MDEIPAAVPDGRFCVGCGRPLRGIRLDSNCPRCGTAVALTPAPIPETTPDSAACLRCAYALRGLPVDGRCPECGLSVARSLGGDVLQYSEPAYLRRLLNGTKLVLWSTLGFVLIVGASVVLAVLGEWDVFPLIGLGLLGTVAAFIAGWWMLTWPDPGQFSRNKGQRPRRMVRYSLIAIAAVALGELIMPYVSQSRGGALPMLVSLLVLPAMAVGLCAGMVYIRWLAGRLPDVRVQRGAQTVLILFGWIAGANVLAIVCGVMTDGGGAVACFVGALLSGAFVAEIAALVLFCRLFAGLRRRLVEIAAAGGAVD